MKTIILFLIKSILFILMLISTTRLRAQTYPELPILNWEQRSDWLNVKDLPSTVYGGVSAKGDGVADDTQAIQAAFEEVRKSGSTYSTVYLPEGTYRITNTIYPPYVKHVAMHLRGHGRNTKIVWHGASGGRMFRSDSAPFSSYIGVVWDGRGVAAEGFIHDTSVKDSRETKLHHQHVAFMNFTNQGSGTAKNKPDQAHTEGSGWYNCLFINCGIGLALWQHNDYVITIDGCEFHDSGHGIYSGNGNFYVRNSHFARSKQADILNNSDSQSSSTRRVTSVGSRAFYERPGGSGPQFTMQDCHISGWTNTSYAVRSSSGARHPLLIFDCSFKNAPSSNPPVSLGGATALVHSNNVWTTGEAFAGGSTQHVQEIPKGTRGGVVTSANQKFFSSTEKVPGKVFSATSFNSAGIQKAVDDARAHGNGAIAYLPRGNYTLAEPINITGGNYYIGGSGTTTTRIYRSNAATAETPDFIISDPQNLIIEHIGFWNPGNDLSKGNPKRAFIRVNSTTTQTSYLKIKNVFTQSPNRPGVPTTDVGDLELKDIAKGSTIILDGFMTGLPYTNGQMLFENSSGARIMLNHAEGSIGIKGNTTDRSGFLGVLSHQGPITIEDNHSLVTSDSYFEQGQHEYVRLKGFSGLPAGRVTLSAARLHTWKARDVGWQDDFIIENYHGNLALVGTKCNSPSEPEAVYRCVQTGSNPFSVLLLSNLYFDAAPSFSVASGVSTSVIGCWVHRTAANGGPYPVPNSTHNNSMLHAAQALDHLRELGAYDLEINYGIEEITALPEHPHRNSSVSIYPSVTSDMIYFKNLPERSSVELIDVAGRTLLVIDASKADAGLSLQTFKNGLYIIRVIRGLENVQTMKVFKK